MSSSVDIANQALTKVGADRIISFADETTEANTMATIYEPAKAALLRGYPWNCAIKRAKVAKLADSPLNEYAFQFQIPEDCLRVLEVWVGKEMRPGRDMNEGRAWAIEGRKIMTHEDNVYIKYIDNIAEPALDAHVEIALVDRLAFEASYTLQASPSTQQTFGQIAQMSLSEAQTSDNLEQASTVFRIDTLTVVR